MATSSMTAAKSRVCYFDLLDRVQERHETVIITKHGRAVAKIVPVDDEDDPRLYIGKMAHRKLFDLPVDQLASMQVAEPWGDPE